MKCDKFGRTAGRTSLVELFFLMKLHQFISWSVCLSLLAFTFQFRFCQLGKLSVFLLYVSKQSVRNSFSKYLLGKGRRECKIVFQFNFIKSYDDFTFGPNLLIYNNQTLSNLGLSSNRARLEHRFLKYLFLASYFFVVKLLPSRLPWPVTFPQNIFCCDP